MPITAVRPVTLPPTRRGARIARILRDRRVFRAAWLAVLTACGGGGTADDGDGGTGPGGPTGTVAMLQVLSGSGQTGEVDTQMAAPIVVRATNTRGAAVSGATVTVANVGDGARIAPAAQVTDGDGRASFTWTLGATSGAQVARFRAASAPELSVSATATPMVRTLEVRTPLLIGDVGAPTWPTVRVQLRRARDQTPLAGHRVRAVTTSGGTIAPAEAETAADGTVAFTWTLGSTAGSQQATVSLVDDPAVTRTLSATAVLHTPLGSTFADAQFSSIAGGSFRMGADSGGTFTERPVRTVTVSGFRMQRTEVTQGQWRQVMMGTPLESPSHARTCGDRCPVELVSWDDIQQFLVRLNQMDPGKGYRLPTEAEWEYAARAGTTGDFGVAGATPCDFAWTLTGNCSQERVWPVAQKTPNAWGLYDMHGNVWEFVQDWLGIYPSVAQTNPTGPPTGESRALRGGSYNDEASTARSSSRFGAGPALRFIYNGFRVVRDP